jgi:uncharacterized protein (TIGR02145 family)
MRTVKVILGIIFTILLVPPSGCKKEEPNDTFAVTTDSIGLFSRGIYIFKGTIVSIGNESISEHGFFWSELQNPEIDGKIILLGPVSSKGSFTSMIYDCLPGKTYYVKAFARTGATTYYGSEKSFVTPDSLVTPVLDIDHNIYYPVRIGDQTWMDGNLKAIRYPDGSSIPLVEDQTDWFNFSLYSQAYCWYDNYGAIGAQYGGLYTWPAAMNISSGNDIIQGEIQGVCPDGWHIPSDEEWKQLELYLGMSQAETESEGWRGDDEGGKIKSEGTNVWEAPNTGATNESGFNALPAGYRDGAGYFNDLGTAARFWSSSKSGDYALIRELDHSSSQIYRATNGLYEGNSVRCIKDSR